MTLDTIKDPKFNKKNLIHFDQPPPPGLIYFFTQRIGSLWVGGGPKEVWECSQIQRFFWHPSLKGCSLQMCVLQSTSLSIWMPWNHTLMWKCIMQVFLNNIFRVCKVS